MMDWLVAVSGLASSESPAMEWLRGNNVPHCIRNANGRWYFEKSKSGIDRMVKIAYY